MRPFPHLPRAAGALAALALVVRLAAPAHAAARPPVTLVETRPVETTLGDPELPQAADVWLEMIGGAKHTLDIEQFYCSDWPGEPMHPVLEAIGAAAKRGVKVRFLLDARMHATYPMPADSLAKVPGIAVRLVDYRRVAGGVQHAKYFIVDGASVFLGSQNFDWRALKHIHELGVRVDDRRIAAVYQPAFDMDWAAGAAPGDSVTTATLDGLRAGAGKEPEPALPIVVVQAAGDTARLWPGYTPKPYLPVATLWDLDAIVHLLDSAQRTIGIQVLNYGIGGRALREPALDEALRRAAARGVKVRLLVSDWETSGITDLQKLVTVPNVEVKMGTVPEWSGGYIPFGRVEHLKYAVVDGERLWVGTSNWEPDYFHATRNLGLSIANRRLAGQAERIFATSWEAPGAQPVKPDVQYPRKQHGETSPDGRPVYGR